jgi:hypothetical protein
MKLNVNGTGDKEVIFYEININSATICRAGAAGDKCMPYGSWNAGDTVRFYYDGSYWVEVLNLTKGSSYAKAYWAGRADSATSASTSTTRDTTDNSTNIATTAFVKSVLPDTSGFLTSSASALTKNYIVKGNNDLNVNTSGVQIDNNNNVVIPATSGFKIGDRVSINYNSTRQALYISVL